MGSGWNFTTNATDPVSSDGQSNPNAFLFQFVFGSSVYMSVISFTTVVANSLLLMVFWLDPSKTFRNPASFFLAALGLLDLVTGLVQEPIYASCFMLGYFKHPAAKRHCPKLLQIGRIVAITSINASFIIVLAFTATQLLAITAPFTYAALVTRRAKVIAAVAGIYAYCILFGLLHLIQFPDPNTLSKVDLFLHSFFLVYLTIAIYIVLYRAFRRRMQISRFLRSDSSLRQSSSSLQRSNDHRVGRRFVAVNFSLVCLVFFCTQPSALLQLLNLFVFDNTPRLNMLIASLMVDNLLYLKFALDPFIYAWRLPKYRKALRIIFCSKRFGEHKEANPAELAFPRTNKSTETVVALSFRCLADDQCAEGTTQ